MSGKNKVSKEKTINHRTELQLIYPHLRDFGIEWFGFYSNKTPLSGLERHNHENCYEICYLEQGMQPYFIYNEEHGSDGDLYRLYGGEVFITKPNEYHSTGEFRQLRGRLFWIQFDSSCPSLLGHSHERTVILQNALKGINRHMLRIPASAASKLTEAYDLMLVADDERFFRACELLTLFILELADFNRKISDETYRYGTVSAKGIEAISFIQNNLLSPDLNLDSVAQHLHYSRSYAMTAFKNEIGMTIHEYILRSRIEYACELLNTHSITETALILNFSSSQHFSKAFRDHTGMTPTEYLRSLGCADLK